MKSFENSINQKATEYRDNMSNEKLRMRKAPRMMALIQQYKDFPHSARKFSYDHIKSGNRIGNMEFYIMSKFAPDLADAYALTRMSHQGDTALSPYQMEYVKGTHLIRRYNLSLLKKHT